MVNTFPARTCKEYVYTYISILSNNKKILKACNIYWLLVSEYYSLNVCADYLIIRNLSCELNTKVERIKIKLKNLKIIVIIVQIFLVNIRNTCNTTFL